MSKIHLSLQGKTGAWMSVTLAALAFTACDDVYDGDETFTSDVRNQILVSPAESDIVVTPSTDGASQTFTWPVVHGAGGYEVSLYDVTLPDAPVVIDKLENDTVDGCQLTASRMDDTNYRLVVRTLGNVALNNKDAETATSKAFTTFATAFATIPDGSDIAQWFAANPIPDDQKANDLVYDLVPGGSYTLGADVDFGTVNVTLRTPAQTNHAKVTIASEAALMTQAGFTLKYIDFDCSQTLKPVVELSSTPDEALKGLTGDHDYYNILDPITFNGCNFEGVNHNLIHDGNVKYCIGAFMINNCKVHLTSSSQGNVNGNAIIYMKAGYINDMTIQKSTIWNTGDSDCKYFIQYNNSGRCDRAGYTSNSVNIMNTTMYNVAKSGQFANYSGFAGRESSNWVMTNNIFVDCSNSQLARRFLGGRQNQATATFANNTYMCDGAFDNVEGYDNSGTQIEVDPGFADPANGNFTPSGAPQLEKGTGDPRWLPSNE